ncbi:MAG: hypothetical protein ACXITV_04655 [Luteibaculaceae bacterium]
MLFRRKIAPVLLFFILLGFQALQAQQTIPRVIKPADSRTSIPNVEPRNVVKLSLFDIPFGVYRLHYEYSFFERVTFEGGLGFTNNPLFIIGTFDRPATHLNYNLGHTYALGGKIYLGDIYDSWYLGYQHQFAQFSIESNRTMIPPNFLEDYNFGVRSNVFSLGFTFMLLDNIVIDSAYGLNIFSESIETIFPNGSPVVSKKETTGGFRGLFTLTIGYNF